MSGYRLFAAIFGGPDVITREALRGRRTTGSVILIP